MSNHDQQEYDWLNDPFDKEKQAEEAEKAHMTTLSCASIAIAFLVALPCAFLFGSFFWAVWIIGTGEPSGL